MTRDEIILDYIGEILYSLCEAGLMNDLGAKIGSQGGKLEDIPRNGLNEFKGSLIGFLNDLQEEGHITINK